MKTAFLIYTLLFFVIFTISCNSIDEVTEPELGQISWHLNGNTIAAKITHANVYSKHDSLYRLTIYSNDKPQFQVGLSYFKLIFEKQIQLSNNLDLKDTFQIDCYTSSGDIFGNAYRLNISDNIEDYLLLTSIDKISGKIEGEFQASFFVDTEAHTDFVSPDILIFTKGKFQTLINE